MSLQSTYFLGGCQYSSWKGIYIQAEGSYLDSIFVMDGKGGICALSWKIPGLEGLVIEYICALELGLLDFRI